MNSSIAVVLTLLMAGCQGQSSMFSVGGRAAADIAWITWVMLAGTGVFMLAMTALGLHAALRRSRGPVGPSGRSIIFWGGIGVPLAVTALLLIYGVRAGHSMLPTGPAELEVRVTAHQWWWHFEYLRPGREPLHTIDELHLPVNRDVNIHVTSVDVIHSFWVPNLGGKIDALPGRVNTIRLHPERVGQMRGLCAEFCGAQHAHMAFSVEIHEADDFQTYLHSLTGANDAPPGLADRQTHDAETVETATQSVREAP